MKVKDLKAELEYYDEDADVVFEVDDEFDVDEVKESKYGWKTAHIDVELEPYFISENKDGDCRILLGTEE